MDFIERWFHVAPDGGNGSLEAAFLVTLGAIVVLIVGGRRVWGRLRGPAGTDRPASGVRP